MDVENRGDVLSGCAVAGLDDAKVGALAGVVGDLSVVIALCGCIGLVGDTWRLAPLSRVATQLPGQLAWFIAGGAIYYFFDRFRRIFPWLLAVSVPVLLFRYVEWVHWLAPAALGIVVVYFACLFRWLGNFGKFGDFSYGIYIVHFPILQTLIAAGLFAESPVIALLLAMLLVIAAAFLFWHGIEKPFLRRSSHYVEVNRD